ncbi:hypothetical protein EYC95_14355 [Pseudomonas sp. BGI-2]|nr:hypothetical protein EYC95_14355 [Pseudomonas sp. BGI-2]
MWERACSRRLFNIQHGSRLKHRFREQARSHILICSDAKKGDPLAGVAFPLSVATIYSDSLYAIT